MGKKTIRHIELVLESIHVNQRASKFHVNTIRCARPNARGEQLSLLRGRISCPRVVREAFSWFALLRVICIYVYRRLQYMPLYSATHKVVRDVKPSNMLASKVVKLFLEAFQIRH